MALIIFSNSQIERPEENQKIIKGADFWAYRLASDLVNDAFVRQQDIVHAAEVAYVTEQKRGYAQGLETAQADAAQKMMDIVNETTSYLIKCEQQFAALVFDAVKQVIGEFDDKTKTIAVAKSAISAMRGQKQITLMVNPEKFESVHSELKALQECYPMVNHIELISHGGTALDACIVTTEIGSAEASITAQLAALHSSLTRVFGPQVDKIIGENDKLLSISEAKF